MKLLPLKCFLPAGALLLTYAALSASACHTTPTPPADDATIVITSLDAASLDAAPATLDASVMLVDASDDSDPADGSDGAGRDDCAQACTNLRRLKCKTGVSVDGGSSCAVTCRHVKTSHVTQLDIACAIRATDAIKLHLCAGWGCP